MTLPKWRVTAKLLAGKKDKQMELPHVEPDLVIGANILMASAKSMNLTGLCTKEITPRSVSA